MEIFALIVVLTFMSPDGAHTIAEPHITGIHIGEDACVDVLTPETQVKNTRDALSESLVISRVPKARLLGVDHWCAPLPEKAS